MSRMTRAGAVIVGTVACSVLAALGAGSAGASVSAQTSGTGKVTVGDNFFKPDDVEVTAGTKVTWTNKGKILHSVTPNKGKKFGAKELPRGKSYSFTFTKPGTYAYYCTFHGSPGRGQHGTIVVKPASPTTTTTAAAG